MNSCQCRQKASRDGDNASRPATRWRRGGEMAGWIIPGATLVLLPKCPICVAMYLALFTGIGISIASASIIRTSLLVVSITVLTGLALWRVWRLGRGMRAMQRVEKEK